RRGRCHPRWARTRTADLQSRTWDHAGDADRPCRADDRPGARRGVAAMTNATPALRALGALALFAVAVALIFVFAGEGFYLWAKAIHIIAVIAWMAGMLYLPRLFVYHADTEKGSVQSETFKVMERR